MPNDEPGSINRNPTDRFLELYEVAIRSPKDEWTIFVHAENAQDALEYTQEFIYTQDYIGGEGLDINVIGPAHLD